VQCASRPLPTAEAALAGQAPHAALPDMVLNVPASHAVHSVPSAPVFPGLHLQSVSSPEPATELELAGHGAQLPAPVASLNSPGRHGEHAPPSGPE